MDKTLVKLQEECAEVIHIISKIHRFGKDNYSPLDQKRTRNIALLELELGDLLDIIKLITNNKRYGITASALEVHALAKIEKSKKW